MKKRTIIIALLLFFATAFLVSYFAVRKAYNDNVHVEFKPISYTEDEKEVAVPKGKDRINVLLLGMEQTRTDMIMVATFNPDRRTLDVISLPRDIYVDRQVRDNTLKKLNSLYEFPKSDGGIERLAKEVSRLLNIPIHDYVMIDYQAVGEIVNAVGGIDVDIPFAMYYDDPYSKPPLNIYFPRGYTHLDGSNAIKYLRWRQNNDGTHGAEGDEGRIKRHQAFIQKLLDKALNPATLPKVVEVAFKNVKTSLEFNQVSGIIADAASTKREDIHFYHVVGTNAYFNSLWYFLVDEQRTQTLMQKIIHYKAITDDDLNPSKSFESAALSRDRSQSYIGSKSTKKKTVEETKQHNDIFFEHEQNPNDAQAGNAVNPDDENNLNSNQYNNQNSSGQNSPTDEDINNSVTNQDQGQQGTVNPNPGPTDSPILDNPQPVPQPAPAPQPVPAPQPAPVPQPEPDPQPAPVDAPPESAPIF